VASGQLPLFRNPVREVAGVERGAAPDGIIVELAEQIG
jgi:hypothetical protein